MKHKKPLSEAFVLMPEVFTSKYFARIAREKGMTKEETGQGHCANFLHKMCIKDQNSRTWFKKIKPVEQKTFDLKVDQSKVELSETKEKPDAYYIDILKSRGYNISKLIQF